jgi:hypothetical protein
MRGSHSRSEWLWLPRAMSPSWFGRRSSQMRNRFLNCTRCLLEALI